MEEVRDKVYDWTLELVKEGKILQGLILMLSTWNFATFRYHMKKFRLNKFEKTLKECNFDYFKDKKFEDMNFDNEEVKKNILEIYEALSSFNGVKYVGATKVMHFLCPEVFVMWDSYVIKYYKCGVSGEDYIAYLKKMQEMYKKGEFKKLEKGVTIARAIDIYNIQNFSIFKE